MGRPAQLVCVCAQFMKVCGRKKLPLEAVRLCMDKQLNYWMVTEQARAWSSLITAFDDKVIFFIDHLIDATIQTLFPSWMTAAFSSVQVTRLDNTNLCHSRLRSSLLSCSQGVLYFYIFVAFSLMNLNSSVLPNYLISLMWRKKKLIYQAETREDPPSFLRV